MKLKLILMISLLSIMVSGCSKEDEDLVSEGKIALEKHEYEKARDLLSDALQEDSEDDEARDMYMQAVRMENAKKYETEFNYEKAIKELEVIEELKNGSSDIKSEAEERKKELETLNDKYKESQEERRANAKKSSKDGIDISRSHARKAQARIFAQEELARKKEAEEKKKQEQIQLVESTEIKTPEAQPTQQSSVSTLPPATKPVDTNQNNKIVN